jgi:hypothetical protein
MTSQEYEEVWQACTRSLEFTRDQWEDCHNRKHLLSGPEIREIHDCMVDLKYALDGRVNTPEYVKEFRRKYGQLNKLILIAVLKMGYTPKSFNT